MSTPVKALDYTMLIKLVLLATNNTNEHESNLAAKRVCKMIVEADYVFPAFTYTGHKSKRQQAPPESQPRPQQRNPAYQNPFTYDRNESYDSDWFGFNRARSSRADKTKGERFYDRDLGKWFFWNELTARYEREPNKPPNGERYYDSTTRTHYMWDYGTESYRVIKIDPPPEPKWNDPVKDPFKTTPDFNRVKCTQCSLECMVNPSISKRGFLCENCFRKRMGL